MSAPRNLGILRATEVTVDAIARRISRILLIDNPSSGAIASGPINFLAAVPDLRIYVVTAADALCDAFGRAPENVGMSIAIRPSAGG
jgi:hypothetical protein